MSSLYEELLKAAKSGDISAQKEFGYFCLDSKNRSYSYIRLQAFEWFRKAAKEDAEAQYIISFLYLNGIGRKQNKSTAKQWYEKAVKNGQSTTPVVLLSLFKDVNMAFPDVFETDKTDKQSGQDSHSQSDNDSNEDTSGISFRDIVFKKDDDGNEILEVIEMGKDDAEENDQNLSDIERYSSFAEDREKYSLDGSYSEYKDYDDWLYTGKSLTIIEPDLSQDPDQALNKLVGLDAVKRQLNDIQKRMAFDALRDQKKLSQTQASEHFVFSGNPGTGKNEFARILGHVLKHSGLLEKGHVVEVDRGNLVGAYVGHSALKTKAAIKAAKGGVLFIDEAYSLYDYHSWGFGDEVISTLMKAMEDQRNDFIVVLAGYKDEMKTLLKSNPGLKSRFRHHISFDDYTAEELVDIFMVFCQQHDFKMHKDAKLSLLSLMKSAIKYEDHSFGNGRFVRNTFEKTLEKMAVRVMQTSDKPDKRVLQTIIFSDIPSLEEVSGKTQNKHATGDVVSF